MSIKLLSANLSGLTCELIDVEVDLTKGLAKFTIVGLPDKSVAEARERVSSAIVNSGSKPPQHQNKSVTVNLAPADIKKKGTWFDLPIALAFLVASEQLHPKNPEIISNLLVVGELGLNGELRRVNGVLAAAKLAKEKGAILVLPKANKEEAMILEGLPIIAVDSLKSLIEQIEEGIEPTLGHGISSVKNEEIVSDFDFAYIRGQAQAKRALEIAAAGNHNVLMSGPPGAGKTLLARALPTIMAPLSGSEMLDVTTIWSVAGLLHDERPLVMLPPFRSPHHSASRTALVGGGSGQALPGEVTLAHRGALFLDELPEFPRHVLEALRQPIEDGIVTVSRSGGTATYPARFLLLAAQNPCPCGNLTDPERDCICSAGDIQRYQRRVSGPILDRIDIVINVPRIPFADLRDAKDAEPSFAVRERVVAAREKQSQRYGKQKFATNTELRTQDIKIYCDLDSKGEGLLHAAHDRFKLSPRAVTRILKVARTIADLSGDDKILDTHLAEAIQYRRMHEGV